MISTWWLLALHAVVAIPSIIHALLYKKDPRSALGWIAVCFAYPFIGPLLYYLFGINRVKTTAFRLHNKPVRWLSHEWSDVRKSHATALETLPEQLSNDDNIRALAISSAAVTRRPALAFNQVTPFFNGEDAYQAMLDAIDNARDNICLATYIFETNQTGRAFITALANARKRGVQVRVLLDGFGEYYSIPMAGRLLKRHKIQVARFTPPKLIPPSLHINLRNHRKLLIVDNAIGFTGGMNIGDRHLQKKPKGKLGINDIHFSLRGKIVSQLQQVFEVDWAFVEKIPVGALPPSTHTNLGNAICRVITDGPNEDLGKLAMVITGAVALAKQRVAIMTPYFLPQTILINALQNAALRGVEVNVILPSKSNQPLVHWATRNMLWELLQCGVNIFYQPAPFNHTKLMLIDNHYAHIGSANLDSRSLRLNFELIVEIFDQDFVHTMSEHFHCIQERSTPVTLKEVDGRGLLTRIRDATAWLFSPYL